MNLFHQFIEFTKKETVLVIATFAAVITAFIVKPSTEYISYIDFRVLALLFSLMLVVSGLHSIGVFEKALPLLLKHTKNIRQLTTILTLTCFFISMWVTNDVALITLIPFTILVINKIKMQKQLINIIVMQTVAANLGSMCTPIGNPQNLYLYTISGMNIGKFLGVMLPYSLASLVLILLSMLLVKPEKIEICPEVLSSPLVQQKNAKQKLIGYLFLFFVCLLTILHLVDYRITLAIVLLSIVLLEKRLFLTANYSLLLTFVAFFVFVGNLKNMQIIHVFLSDIIKNQEVLVSIISSQVISNVPAAVLLSGFTKNTDLLMIGTNLGGLGTLIASMASLISYQYYCNTTDCKKGKYLVRFTVVNVLFLVVLMGLYYLGGMF